VCSSDLDRHQNQYEEQESEGRWHAALPYCGVNCC
jgi:hypothetical protein